MLLAQAMTPPTRRFRICRLHSRHGGIGEAVRAQRMAFAHTGGDYLAPAQSKK
jgi:hypothetical protein